MRTHRASMDPRIRLAWLVLVGLSLAWVWLLLLYGWFGLKLWHLATRSPAAIATNVDLVLPCPRAPQGPLPPRAGAQQQTARQKAEIEAEQDCSTDARYGRSIRLDAWGRRTDRPPGRAREGGGP